MSGSLRPSQTKQLNNVKKCQILEGKISESLKPSQTRWLNTVISDELVDEKTSYV